MKFVWFILAKCNIAMPSFPQVKAFQLPGMMLPIRVRFLLLNLSGCDRLSVHKFLCSICSLMEFPFYVNSISSILRRCIGSPKISQTICHYPVLATGAYRYINLYNQ